MATAFTLQGGSILLSVPMRKLPGQNADWLGMGHMVPGGGAGEGALPQNEVLAFSYGGVSLQCLEYSSEGRESLKFKGDRDSKS